MKNSITATIEFYFKGVKFTPSITIDLDLHLQGEGGLPDFCSLIAKTNNIDIYSYEYEMMQAEQVNITDAQGMVTKHVIDGVLNYSNFENEWKNDIALQDIKMIVRKNMAISDLQQHPEFEKTLLEIYKLGLKD